MRICEASTCWQKSSVMYLYEWPAHSCHGMDLINRSRNSNHLAFQQSVAGHWEMTVSQRLLVLHGVPSVLTLSLSGV